MGSSVCFYEDAASFSSAAEEFLLSRPVLNNVILTRLGDCLTRHEPGRYWVATKDSQVSGVVFQSPLTHPALLVAMELSVVTTLVDAIADAGIALPGVIGDAGTAASFAGRWTERHRAAVFPTRGLLLYALAELRDIGPVPGKLRIFEPPDRNLVIPWVRAFDAEVQEPETEPDRKLDEFLVSGQIWLWDDNGISSMAVSRKPVARVVRFSEVYTPPQKRKCGYAAASVYGMSKHFSAAGHRCILYTDLGNPVSNSIYRRIGYSAISESTHYRFDQQ
jgi:hypothetical protein